jgi:hypothetical protein
MQKEPGPHDGPRRSASQVGLLVCVRIRVGVGVKEVRIRKKRNGSRVMIRLRLRVRVRVQEARTVQSSRGTMVAVQWCRQIPGPLVLCDVISVVAECMVRMMLYQAFGSDLHL